MIKSLTSRQRRRKKDPDRLRGHLDYMEQGVVGGWAGRPSSSSSTMLEARINGELVASFTTSGSRHDLAALGFSPRNNCGFRRIINVYPYLKTAAAASNRLSVRVVETGQELVGSPLDLPRPDFRYEIDRIDSSGIHGWIYDANYSELDLALDIAINGKKVVTLDVDLERPDLPAHGHPKSCCGFYLDHTAFLEPDQFALVTAFVAGTEIEVFRQPLVIEPLGAKLTGLAELAREARRLAEDTADARYAWILQDLLPKLMEEARRTRGASLPAGYSGRSLHSGKKRPEWVDVIIPVYEGLKETLDCIESVLASGDKQKHRLIVINDKSPNPKLSSELRAHARRHGYSLLENERNLGFVGTVNRGMALHEDADVVLLNADTLVPDGWLDQLVAQAYSDPTIATVTPFSNNATICSYPNFCQDNKLPEGADVDELNRLFRKANAGKAIDLPTAHGFCMFIKRAALKEVGLFDEAKWGKGYGEENDFSLRAEQRGWRNVMALDTFVQHLGSVSFAANAEEFIARNLEALQALYPDYAEKVAAFIQRDPVRPYRNAVALEQLKQEVEGARAKPPAKGKTMLFVSLTFGGGTKVATDDLARLLRKEGQCVLLLTSPKKGVWRVSSHLSEAHLEYRWPEEKEQLLADLKALDVWHLHYHHTIEFPKEVWELPEALGVEYDVTIHDYFTICPRVNLIDETRRYCGEPPVTACERCIKLNGVHEGTRFGLREFGKTVADWRDFHQERLEGARRVLAPSEDAARRVSRHFPGLEPLVCPHPEEPFEFRPQPLRPGKTLNVAFLGAIGVHKGYDYLVGCVRHAQKWDLPLHFHVIGFTMDDEALAEFDKVTLHGAYRREELPGLIEKAGCQVALLLSVWPETYGYVLSEALQNNLLPLALDKGAIADRIRRLLGEAFVLPFSSSPEEVNERLVSLLEKASPQVPPPRLDIGASAQYKLPLSDYYEFASK